MGFRFLTEDEAWKTKELYARTFSEDGEQFIDAFYEHEAMQNRIAVYEEDGHIISMLQLHPVMWSSGEKTISTYFVVAVATDIAHRKKGHYEKLLRWVLASLYEEGVPFCYLMPADERIYIPYGFQRVQSLRRQVVKAHRTQKFSYDVLHELTDLDLAWMNDAKKDDIHLVRDRAWARRVLPSYAAQGGGIVRVMQGDRVVAYLRFACEPSLHIVDSWASSDVAEDVILSGFVASQGATSATVDDCNTAFPVCRNDNLSYMMRIVNLASFVRALTPKGNASISCHLMDPLLPQQDGAYTFEAREEAWEMRDAFTKPVRRMGVSELLRTLCGYEKRKELWIHEVV